jgi:hypothetical protein
MFAGTHLNVTLHVRCLSFFLCLYIAKVKLGWGSVKYFSLEKMLHRRKFLKIPDLMALRRRHFETVLTNNEHFIFSIEYYA